MGGSYSVDSSYGFIAIQLNQQKYFPGSQVNGWIYLNILKPFHTNSLQILITGKEKTKVVYVTTNSDDHGSHRDVHTDKAKKEFFAYHYEIHSHLPDQFPGGQYSYPFSFLLPYNLPPSFAFEWTEEGKKCYGKIEYKVKAVLMQQKTKKMLQYKAPILLDRAPVNAPQLSPEGVYEENVKGYCGTDKGYLRIRSIVEKAEYQVGETANIQVEVDASKMNAHINAIKCTLRQYVTVKGRHHTKHHNMEIGRRDLPGIPIGQIIAGSQAFRLSMPISTMGPFQSNVTGENVQCYYALEQLCEVDRCQCYNPDAKSALNIIVINSPMGAFQLPNIPSNVPWQPQMMSPQVFSPSAQYAINDDFRKQMEGIKQV
jgi:hypothetical protein